MKKKKQKRKHFFPDWLYYISGAFMGLGIYRLISEGSDFGSTAGERIALFIFIICTIIFVMDNIITYFRK